MRIGRSDPIAHHTLLAGFQSLPFPMPARQADFVPEYIMIPGTHHLIHSAVVPNSFHLRQSSLKRDRVSRMCEAPS